MLLNSEKLCYNLLVTGTNIRYKNFHLIAFSRNCVREPIYKKTFPLKTKQLL